MTFLWNWPFNSNNQKRLIEKHHSSSSSNEIYQRQNVMNKFRCSVWWQRLFSSEWGWKMPTVNMLFILVELSRMAGSTYAIQRLTTWMQCEMVLCSVNSKNQHHRHLMRCDCAHVHSSMSRAPFCCNSEAISMCMYSCWCCVLTAHLRLACTCTMQVFIPGIRLNSSTTTSSSNNSNSKRRKK